MLVQAEKRIKFFELNKSLVYHRSKQSDLFSMIGVVEHQKIFISFGCSLINSNKSSKSRLPSLVFATLKLAWSMTVFNICHKV
jgi:hypothetical protein